MRCDVSPITANVKDGALHASSLRVYELLPLKEEEEEEEFYKLLPANKADHLRICQSLLKDLAVTASQIF